MTDLFTELSYNDIKNDLVDMTIWVEGKEYQGKFTGFRFDHNTLPYPLQAFDMRHSDDDMDPLTITRGRVFVNRYGTFVCESIEGLELSGSELDIEEYDYSENECYSELNDAIRKFVLEHGEVVETIEGTTTEKSIHIAPLYVEGCDITINEIVADSDPSWTDVILSDCDEADLRLYHLSDNEIEQLINSIRGFSYDTGRNEN